MCSGHALMAGVRQDLYTQRAASKLRGYAGDAVMLDDVYSGRPLQGTSALGAAIFGATTRAPSSLSVRDEAALLRLCQQAGAQHRSSFNDPHRNVVYAQLNAPPWPETAPTPPISA